MSEDKLKILYVDDEENNLFSFKAVFRREYEVLTAISGEEGIKILEQHQNLQVIVSDQRMPGMSGIEFLAKAKEIIPEGIRILLTGYSDINAVIDAINKGEVYRYVSKPWNEEDLKQIIAQGCELFSLRKENVELTEKLKSVNQQLEFLLRQKLIS